MIAELDLKGAPYHCESLDTIGLNVLWMAQELGYDWFDHAMDGVTCAYLSLLARLTPLRSPYPQ